MAKFKVGDRVRILTTSTSEKKKHIGKVITIHRIYPETGFPIESDDIDRWAWADDELELVKGGKPMKPKKIDKHAVIIDSCFNLVAFKNSLKDA